MGASDKPSIVVLDNPLQHYAWGSRSAIAALQGRPTPTSEPEAELWMGDHPVAPSSVETEGAAPPIPLSEWIARDPDAVLGPRRASEARLPFLAKLLAAARPLSLQVHPNEQQARAGYAREEAAGTPSELRCYRDPRPKHEMLVALSRFEALCGFRTDAQLEALVARSGSGALEAELRSARAPTGPESAQSAAYESAASRLLRALHALAPSEQQRVYDELRGSAAVAAAGAGTERDALYWVARLCEEVPGDPLVAAPLLMNLVVLEPGEGVVVAPGTLHTYLEGFGFEVMTPSDNVVRAGLSPKHVDPGEFRRIAATGAGPVASVRPARRPGTGEAAYPTGTPRFDVSELTLGSGHPLRAQRVGGRVTLVVCVEGSVEVGTGSEEHLRSVSLGSGEAALVPASLEGHTILSRAPAKVFLVSAGG